MATYTKGVPPGVARDSELDYYYELVLKGVALLRPLGLILLSIALLVLFWLAGNKAIQWGQNTLDDIRYGNPRTFQADIYVGHNEQAGLPSHFIAMNLHRRISIVEMQGSDSKVIKIYQGPYLFGQDEDLTPVRLEFKDLNGDGYPDMILIIKQESVVFINDHKGQSFRPLSPSERLQVEKALNGVK